MDAFCRISVTLMLMFLSASNCYFINEIKPQIYDEYQNDINRLVKGNTTLKKWAEDMYDEKLQDFEESSGEVARCRWESKVIKPYTCRDRNGTVIFLVAQSEGFVQQVLVTRCLNLGQSCHEDVGLDQFHIKTICGNQIDQMTFYIYDTKMKQIKVQNCYVPVCCFCMLEDI